MPFHNLFIPHRETHKKAYLISWEAIVIYALIFLLLKISFSLTSFYKPGVLGINSAIDQHQLIELTNKEREAQGLPPLRENTALNKAAQLKAENMFVENYWAHFAPSGKTPWDFILGAGYKFTFAGENLAKNFYTSNDIVKAWMNSPTHRENIVNSKYEDIGIAVVEGTLDGEKTTLVIQEFGSTRSFLQVPTVNVGGDNLTVSKQDYENAPLLVAGLQNNVNFKPLLDPHQSIRIFGIAILALVSLLLLLDFIITKRRGVFKIRSHHITHLALLSVTLAALMSSSAGKIL